MATFGGTAFGLGPVLEAVAAVPRGPRRPDAERELQAPVGDVVVRQGVPAGPAAHERQGARRLRPLARPRARARAHRGGPRRPVRRVGKGVALEHRADDRRRERGLARQRHAAGERGRVVQRLPRAGDGLRRREGGERGERQPVAARADGVGPEARDGLGGRGDRWRPAAGTTASRRRRGG
jgi:hypothetical protein